MQLISDKYRELNKKLHEENKYFGSFGFQYLDDVLEIATELKTQDILDYGCGKSTLANNLPFKIHQYDPAVQKYSSLPHPADVVVCNDMLEHVEPEYLDNVLKHLQSLLRRVGLFTIGLGKAVKELPDGRNAHLIQETERFWILKLLDYFEITRLKANINHAAFIVRPLEIKNNA